jgi:hypothetical protein
MFIYVFQEKLSNYYFEPCEVQDFVGLLHLSAIVQLARNVGKREDRILGNSEKKNT